MSNQIRQRYDIIINGGGIVGFTLLNLLQKAPHLSRCKVLLIEQAQKPSSFLQPSRSDSENNFSNRVSSITYSSKSTFKKLGVWDKVKPYAKDIKRIKVWNYDYPHNIVFKQDLPAGHLEREERDIVFSTLENNRLSAALLESIHEYSNRFDEISWSTKLVSAHESPEAGSIDVRLNNENGEDLNVSTSLILGCDGYGSKMRELTEMKYTEFNLKKTAVVGTVKMSPRIMDNDNDVAYQKFSAKNDTVVALLPLDREFSSFVISAPESYAKHLKECDEQIFLKEINGLLTSSEVAPNLLLRGFHELANATYDNLNLLFKIVGPQLGLTSTETEFGFDTAPTLEQIVPDSRASFPLIFGTTSPKMISSLPGSSRPQVALLGDSSHRIHPLAGQGLNLGIQDAVEMVRQLEDLAKTGVRLFTDTSFLAKALRRYELKRQAYVLPISASVLMMQGLFKLAPSRMLSGFDRCQILKTTSVRIANGCR